MEPGITTNEGQTRTPLAVTPHIRRLVKKLRLAEDPVFVPVHAAPGAIRASCFANVAAHVERSGGTSRYGWAIWEWPRVLVEAEFHSVWVSIDGVVSDVTPQERDATHILFVEDCKRIFTGRQFNNVRMPLRDDQLVRDLISLADAEYRVLNRGERRPEFGHVAIPRAEIEPILAYRNLITQRLRAGDTEKSACFCGSGQRYRNCCTTAIAAVVEHLG